MDNGLPNYINISEIISMKFPEEHREDLVSEAIVKYYELIDTYDPDKGVTFGNYCWKPIYHVMVKYMRMMRPHSSLDLELTNDDNPTTLGDVIADDYNLEEEYINKEYVEKWMDKLTPIGKEVVDMYIEHEMTKNEIKKTLKLSTVKLNEILKPSTIAKKGEGVAYQAKYSGMSHAEQIELKYTTEIQMLKDGMSIASIHHKTTTSRNTLYKIIKMMDDGEIG